MGATVCLAIGVGDAPPLDYLRGAINGARGLAAWAREHGYQTILLTDEKRPVGRSDVTRALGKLLAPAPEALILYFAGHGLSRAAGEDLWLLSRWHVEDRAVLVAGLRDRLSFHGLKRLILISDACRSPVNVEAQTIEGDSLLERGPFNEQQPQMDIWYSASRGRAAFMVPGEKPLGTRCVFSGLLTEALAGAHDAAFDANDPTRPITSFSLADFLEREVPVRAAHYGATLNPVITTAIRPPRNRYREGPPAKAPTFPPWPPRSAAGPITMGDDRDGTRIEPPPGASWTTRSVEAPQAAPSSGFGIQTEMLALRHRPFGCLPTLIIPVGALAAFSAIWTLFPLSNIRSEGLEEVKWGKLIVGFLRQHQSVLTTLLLPVLFSLAILFITRFSYRGRSADLRYNDKAELRYERLERRATGNIKRAIEDLLGDIAIGGEPGTAAGDNKRPDESAWRKLSGDFAIAVSGSSIRDALPKNVGERRIELRHGSSSLEVRGGVLWPEADRPLDLLVQLANGDWTNAAILPHYVLSLEFGRGGIRKAQYRKMSEPIDEASEQTMAQFAARGIEGEQTREVAEVLRRGKNSDPILGVIAAYLHHAQADLGNIHRTAFYLARTGVPIPFDIALLGRLAVERHSAGGTTVIIPAVEESPGRATLPSFMQQATGEMRARLAGSFPFLRQGWALLDPEGRSRLYPAGLAALARYLRPAPFTTLDADGGRRLADLISSVK